MNVTANQTQVVPAKFHPLVTLTITAYNHEQFIEEAIRSALAQTYSPLEIIVSDDCSTDNTFEIALKLLKDYTGPHRIVFNRNEQNLGLVAHVNKVLALAQGELVLGSSGDDVSLPNRAKGMVDIYLRMGRCPLLIHGDVQCIDMHGRRLHVMSPPVIRRHKSVRKIALAEGIYIGASAAFSRALLEAFEPIRFAHAWEDLVWGFRAALLNGLVYDPEPHVLYRSDVGITAQMAYQQDFAEFRAANLKRRMIQYDVLRQRLTDARTVDADAAVQDALERRVAVEGIRLALLTDPAGTFSEHAVKQPIKLMSALGLETYAWAQSLGRNILARLRSVA